jgi:hypothetical protein
MEAVELRLGNWYDHHGTPKQVTTSVIEDLWGAPRVWVKPIPITAEWLVKFGFENKGHGYSDNIYYKQQGWYNWAHIVTISDTGIVMKHGFMNQWSELKSLQYVHELQNLYFALTGEELTINK